MLPCARRPLSFYQKMLKREMVTSKREKQVHTVTVCLSMTSAWAVPTTFVCVAVLMDAC